MSKVNNRSKSRKPEKRNLAMSRKTGSSGYRHPEMRQAHVRKSNVRVAVSLDKKRLFSNLGHLVGTCSTGGKVAAYEQIAAKLSSLAGLSDGRSWSWRYVASVHAGTIEPGKKFIRVLALMFSELNLNKKQWFYFTRRRSVAAVYDRLVFAERITTQMRTMGFRAANYSRYMQIKSVATAMRKKGM